MDYYLIDLENVGSRGLYGADLLDGDACIVIFYSSASSTVSGQVSRMLLDGRARILSQNVNVRTKNAMDFALAVMAGKLLAGDPEGKITIISGDSGYKAVLEAGNGKEPGRVFQHHSILEAWYLKERNPGKEANASIKSIMKEIRKRKTLADAAAALSADPELLSAVMEESGSDFRKLYQELLHVFGRERGLRLYRKMKNDRLGPFSIPPGTA